MARPDDAPVRQLHEAIRARGDAFTPTERRIAAFLLEHTRSVALLSVQELAAQAGTGPASIIRFLQRIGYTGLSELKKGLQRQLSDDPSPLEQFTRILTGGEGASGLAEVAAISRQEAKNIGRTFGLLDEEAFQKAVALLVRSRAVYVVGVGVSAHLAGLAAFVLQRVGLRSFALQHTGLNVAEQLVIAGKRDALLAFSFPPYSPETMAAAAVARKRGAGVVSITNQAIAPIARHSDATLVAKTDSLGPSNALSAPLVLVQGLAAAVAAASRPRSLRAMKATLSIRRGH